MADSVIAPFSMHGARDAMASGLTHIEEQVEGIEQAVGENSGLAFDLAKTLIESTCRTVLRERSVLCIVKIAPPTKSRTYAPLEFRADAGETPPLCSTLLSSSSHLASVPFGRCVGAAPTWCWRTSLCGSK